MNVLAIYGSPRRGGVTGRMMDVVCAELEARGHSVERFVVDGCRVAPCRGCLRCRRGGVCVLPGDDGHRLGRLLMASDALVVSSPAYYGQMPGSLKVALDRVVPALVDTECGGLRPAPLHRGQPCLLLTACTARWPLCVLGGVSAGVRRSLRQVLVPAGYRIQACINKADTLRHGELSEADVRRLRRAAARLGGG